MDDDAFNDIEKDTDSINEIIELENTNEIAYDTMPTDVVKEEKKPKKKRNKKWNNLSKKQKILILCGLGVVLLIIIGLLLYFLVFKKDKTEEKPHEPETLVVKEHYRYEDGILVFLNDQKKELGTYECQNKDEEKCFIASYSGEDDFDVVKKVYSDNKGIEQVSDIYHDKYVFIYDNPSTKTGKITLYDITNKEVVASYKLIKSLDDTRLIVENTEDQYGVIELTSENKIVIDFKYDYLGRINDYDSLVAKTGNESQIISFAGEDVSSKVSGNIKNYDAKYISVKSGSEYTLYDYKANKALSKTGEYITLKNGYVFVIDSKKLYAYDDKLNALNYEGIRIDTTEYNKKIVFDEDLKEVERKEEFDIEIGNNSIVIKDGEKTNELSIYDGIISSKFKYVSYYDGVLYFFKDEAKESLIGSYTCTNKNDINSNTVTLDKCYVANETHLLNRDTNGDDVGLIPIYNNRYVFINDTADSSKANIVLWDLKATTSKDAKKATYLAVDTGYYKNDGLAFETTTDRVVMAQNTSGNYGLIKIESNNVAGLIAFKDENAGGETKDIKIVGNYYVATRDKNYLYDKTGNFIASSTEEIVEANKKALKVKNSTLYSVVDLNGKILKASIDYADLYDNFFVAIEGTLSNFTIYVYDYQGHELLSPVTSASGDFASFAEAYKVLNEDTIEILGRRASLN